MVREAYIGDIKIIYLNAGTMQDEINLPHWRVTRMGRHIGEIGIFQAGRGKEKIQLPAAPECVEVAGDDNFLIGVQGKVV